ncbi:uncharacterized protein LOC143277091 [Babylonia areolata]|uniref:uncharacterized protein LOC143277091 n=1 Tax=Babylonia areolata TaxID=304850 RepID=UPI003FD5B963
MSLGDFTCGRHCDQMASPDQQAMSEVKIEIDVAEETEPLWMTQDQCSGSTCETPEAVTTNTSSDVIKTEAVTANTSSDVIKTEAVTANTSSDVIKTEAVTTNTSSDVIKTEPVTANTSSDVIKTEAAMANISN